MGKPQVKGLHLFKMETDTRANGSISVSMAKARISLQMETNLEASMLTESQKDMETTSGLMEIATKATFMKG
jgi:hypothetical protein